MVRHDGAIRGGSPVNRVRTRPHTAATCCNPLARRADYPAYPVYPDPAVIRRFLQVALAGAGAGAAALAPAPAVIGLFLQVALAAASTWPAALAWCQPVLTPTPRNAVGFRVVKT